MNYAEWLTTLDDQQIRALASQANVINWHTFKVDTLRERLLNNQYAELIFHEKANIQNST